MGLYYKRSWIEKHFYEWSLILGIKYLYDTVLNIAYDIGNDTSYTRL